MPIGDCEKWGKLVDANKDPYGASCIAVARQAMRILDETTSELDPLEILMSAAEHAGTDMGGYKARAVVEMVSQCHSRGQEFVRAWNSLMSGGLTRERRK